MPAATTMMNGTSKEVPQTAVSSCRRSTELQWRPFFRVLPFIIGLGVLLTLLGVVLIIFAIVEKHFWQGKLAGGVVLSMGISVMILSVIGCVLRRVGKGEMHQSRDMETGGMVSHMPVDNLAAFMSTEEEAVDALHRTPEETNGTAHKAVDTQGDADEQPPVVNTSDSIGQHSGPDQPPDHPQPDETRDSLLSDEPRDIHNPENSRDNPVPEESSAQPRQFEPCDESYHDEPGYVRFIPEQPSDIQSPSEPRACSDAYESRDLSTPDVPALREPHNDPVPEQSYTTPVLEEPRKDPVLEEKHDNPTSIIQEDEHSDNADDNSSIVVETNETFKNTGVFDSSKQDQCPEADTKPIVTSLDESSLHIRFASNDEQETPGGFENTAFDDV